MVRLSEGRHIVFRGELLDVSSASVKVIALDLLGSFLEVGLADFDVQVLTEM